MCAACSIISVLTQWGATLVTKNKREREREREGSWLELMASAAGLDGEVRGTKVALRECSRLIGVAQPLAGAWLQAIPGPNQFRLRSTLYVIALQRWLGLPIHMASAANVTAAETLGDELLKGCEHTTRHNRVVGRGVGAGRAVRACRCSGVARRGALARDRRGAGVENAERATHRELRMIGAMWLRRDAISSLLIPNGSCPADQQRRGRCALATAPRLPAATPPRAPPCACDRPSWPQTLGRLPLCLLCTQRSTPPTCGDSPPTPSAFAAMPLPGHRRHSATAAPRSLIAASRTHARSEP